MSLWNRCGIFVEKKKEIRLIGNNGNGYNGRGHFNLSRLSVVVSVNCDNIIIRIEI